MKTSIQTILVLCVAVLTSQRASAQGNVIYGTVVDRATSQPLPYANVFINNTTNGSVTNVNGEFSIPISEAGYVEVVASFVGYVTQFEKISINANQRVKIYFALDPLEKQLNEVELRSREDNKWKRQLKRFEEVFIGSFNDPLSGKTTILNPWVINFEEGRLPGGQRYLAASALEPIEIENKGLGYKIIYHMESFQQTRTGFNYQGPIQFIEMDSTEEMKKTWHANRQEVYLGSVRHMFKALINDRLKQEGFEVYTVRPNGKHYVRVRHLEDDLESALDTINRAKMLKPGDRIGDYKVRSKNSLEVHYYKKLWPNIVYAGAYYPISWLTFRDSTVTVSIKGVPYDPNELIIAGYLSRDRMARMLPYNFVPDKNYTSLEPEPSEIAFRQIKYNGLREKPSVQTDKPYYYPGEKIWFKSYMLYQNPLLTDTLSRVLYIDLLNSDNHAVQTLSRPIINGMADGYVELPSSTPPGSYALRAYTNWMRNYDEKDIFHRALSVLALNEKVENRQPLPPEIKDPDVVAELTPSSESYKTRQKVIIQFVLKDADDNPIHANLSVSVTDTLQVATVPEAATLTDAYAWTYGPANSKLPDPPPYQIEYGISVQGTYLNRKGMPEAASITIVQGEYDDYGIAESDSLGRFWASGLQFEDSTEIALGVVGAKGRPMGTVKLDEKHPLQTTEPVSTLDLNIVKTGELHRVFTLPDGEDYEMLEEIVVESSKIEPMSEREYGYGAGDKTFTEKDFEKNPQLSVFEFLGRNGTGRNSFQRHNWGIRAAPPLIIIDGSRYGGNYGETPWQYLESLNVGMIKSINVYTYGATIFGMNGSGGVIMIETKRAERQADEKPTIFNKEGFSLYIIKGYAPVGEFKAPDYSQPRQSHNEPDTRSTLYWNPSLSTNDETSEARFSFYAADAPTVYRIVVEGMTDDNTPVREVRYIEVKR